MTIPTSNFGFAEINVELGKAANAPITLNDADVRALAGKPTGAISFADLAGKSAVSIIMPTSMNLSAGDINPFGNVITIGTAISPASFMNEIYIDSDYGGERHYDMLSDGAALSSFEYMITTPSASGGGTYSLSLGSFNTWYNASTTRTVTHRLARNFAGTSTSSCDFDIILRRLSNTSDSVTGNVVTTITLTIETEPFITEPEDEETP